MKFRVNFTLWIIVCIISPSLYANELMLTLKDLNEKSSDVIIGSVVSIDSFYLNNDTSRIYTSVKIKVAESVKGDTKTGEIVDLIFYGGTLDGRTTTVLGSPRYNIGEETLLFLNERNNEKFGMFYTIYGGRQGKFSIEGDNVTRDSDFPLLKNDIGHYILPNNDSAITRSAFIQEIKKLAN